MGDGTGGGEHRGVSAFTAWAVVVADMVGIGVFTSVGFQVQAVPSGFCVLLLWLLGGVLAVCGSLCYAELAAALPRSGGEYHFLSRIYHPLPGFLSGWISMTVGFAAPIALAAVAFGDYLTGAVPWMNARWLAAGVVLVLAVMHSFNLRLGGAVQNWATGLKLALMTGLCAVLLGGHEPQPVHFLPGPGDLDLVFSGGFAVSLAFVMYSYSGWNAAAYIAGEVRNPVRSLPIALVGGAAAVTIIYLLLNAAFLVSAPMSALAGKVDVAVIATKAVVGDAGARAAGLLMAVGLISTVSAMTWAGPRVSLAMGEDYRMLRWFAVRNRGGIPIVALWFQTALALAMLLSASFRSILLYVEFVLTVSVALAVFGVIWLRWREPDLPRPFRAWGYPWTPLMYLGMSAWFMVALLQRHPAESLAGTATVLLGAGAYWLAGRPGRR